MAVGDPRTCTICGGYFCRGHHGHQWPTPVNIDNQIPITKTELCQINFERLWQQVQDMQKQIDELEDTQS